MRSLGRSAAPLALLAALAAPASAGPLAPTKASQIVSLTASPAFSPDCPGTTPGSGYYLVQNVGNADGSSGIFTIPPKSVLVVTSYTFRSEGPAGTTQSAGIVAIDPATPPGPGAIGALSASGGIAGSNDTVVGTVVLPTGLVVKPPANLCMQLPTGADGAVIVHGFIAKDK